MKVLGLSCSGRKGGNTEILVKAVLASAAEAGAQTELVLVAEQNIAPCMGCFTCQTTNKCAISDDMPALAQKMEEADAIIIGSPVYFGSVSAQAKAVMDRTFLLLRHRKLKGKVGASVLAVRQVGGGLTRSLLLNFFITHGMIPVRGCIGYGKDKGDVLRGAGGALGVTAMDEARNLGKDIVQMLQQMGKK